MKIQLKPYTAATMPAVRDAWNREFERGHKYGTEPSRLAQWAVGQRYLFSGMTVLEVGAGSGRNSIFLARNGMRVVGLDLSEEAIALFCKELASTSIEPGSVTALRADFFQSSDILKAGGFDAIFSNFCLHMMAPELWAEFIHVAARLLAPGGILLLSLLSINDVDHLQAMEGTFDEQVGKGTWIIRGHPQHFFTEREIRALFETAGVDAGLRLAYLEESVDLEVIFSESRKTRFWTVVGIRGDAG